MIAAPWPVPEPERALPAGTNAADGVTEVFEGHRRALFAIAYRMLGSVSEAEDVLQDAYLRVHSAHGDGVRSPRALFSTVVTRLCLDRLKSARARREQYIGPWLPEPLVTAELEGRQGPEAKVIADESISLALLVLLESLTPVERAVFLLHEVFDYRYDEIAPIVERREEACRQLCRRAKRHIAERRPRFSSTPAAQRRLTAGFLQAVTAGDLDALTSLLAEDVTLWSDGGGKVAAALRPLHGRAAVARFLIGVARKAPPDVEFTATEVNGGPGFIVWLGAMPLTVLALDMDGEHIRALRAIGNPDKLAPLRRPGVS